jgi:hypothetical protein
MTTQPTQATAMTRDPHLPPAAVVDWLLEQTWPGEIPETRIDYLGGNPTGVAGSTLLGWQQAYADIGANAVGRIFLDSDALDVLRKDHAIRQVALEERQRALGRILRNAVQNGGRILLQERACEAES